MRKRLLVFAQRQAQLNELIRAAKVLQTVFDTTVCLGSPDAQMSSRCEASGLKWVDISGIPGSDDIGIGWKVRESAVHPLLKLYGKLETPLIKRCCDEELSAIKRASAVMRAYKPSLIIVGEDGLGGQGAILAAAKRWGAKILTVPYEYSTRRQMLLFSQPFEPNFSPFDRKFLKLFPKWKTKRDGKDVVFLPAKIAFARELFRTAPSDPWSVHGGPADRIAVENEFMRRHYLQDGLAPTKLAMVGALANDDLFSALMADPLSEASFKTGSRREERSTSVLCALPPNYIGGYAPNCEFQSYVDLVDFLAAAFNRPGVKVTFQLHPGIAKADADYVRSKVPVVDEDISQLIPAHDALVTTGSSIIRMATTCRKPVLNYDVFGFNYQDYDAVPGVLKARDKSEFIAILDQITNGDRYRATVSEITKNQSDWGYFDGQCGSRLVDLANQMTA